MKRLSLFKKIRLSFVQGNILTTIIAFFYQWLILLTTFKPVENADIAERILLAMGILAYGAMLVMGIIISLSLVISHMKLYKIMPMVKNDITDLMAITTAETVLLFAVSQTTAILLFYEATYLPYFLCMDCVIFGISSFMLLWYQKDKYAYSNAKKLNDDKETTKKKTRLSIRIMLTYFAVNAAAVMLILFRASTVHDPAADAPWLIAVSAASLIIYAAVLVCSKKKIKWAFEI